MKVQVRYFASLREALGTGEGLELPEGSTVAGARDALIARGGAHAEALARGRALRSALNQALCEESAALSDGAELAFFPPVTGG
ncbi:MAG: MoaD/ThiS family protein [Piscinibacter sp.]|uniref:MoaD/ThiS family protein n=1 Tax=Piscinibacter sp. TaxID=1903157 RepID=UPI001B569B59|nr:MoaD/ThiS family protein [Piscinibacter sp.]MBP5992224.1 MoaD/ThiS family protein [Piscinibacter sp.]MBP6029716.1 MoaD/ThiS family protein [Piscinibacter sp.]MBS0436358.1 MoaD/ThiS family protein [Pseudomonadota bacterium]